MYCVPWYLPRAKIVLHHEPLFEKEPSMDGMDMDLERLKEEVGVYKIRHGDEKWKSNVYQIDKQIKFENSLREPVSRAYFKLIEIVRTSSIKPPRASLHLCEAPGGFAQAVSTEFSNVDISVMSRRTDGAQYFSPAVLHDPKITILNLAHKSDILLEAVRHELCKSATSYDLITADGGIDNDNKPELTENATAHLVLCEIDAALRLQRENGSFILKIFSCSRDITKELIAILTTCYREVSMVKPFTSRCVNDERYIVCDGFQKELAPKLTIPDDSSGFYLNQVATVDDDEWLREINSISKKMSHDQRQSIQRALTCTSSGARSTPVGHRGRGPHGRTRGRGHPYQRVQESQTNRTS